MPPALLHVAAAVTALALGAAVLRRSKGDRRHRISGRVYVVCMLVVNIAALITYKETGQFGAFHALAIASLLTLAAGVMPFFLGFRGPGHVERHAYFMSWSYVGLVGAGTAQLANMYLPAWQATVLVASILVVSLGGAAIHRLVPRTVAR